MSLAKYRRKRDFRKTAEPSGAKRPAKHGNSFVVQKHAASHLHYDFRLELDGVLKSWAVPKGPSLDPGVRALAVEVEDHPVEYGGFEGIIPAGEYGGGTVMLWDHGTWECLGNAARDYKAGRLHFRLQGEKLSGEWTLARMKTERGRAQWLLMKRSDDSALRGDEHGLLEREDRSVATGRTMEQIAAQSDRVWGKTGEVEQPKANRKKQSSKKVKPERSSRVELLRGAKKHRAPKTLAPQLATLATAAPDGDQWLHELKFDGYRLLAFGDGTRVRLLTRNGKDWTRKFPRIAELLQEWKFDGIMDGELVALDDAGASNFQKLQNAIRNGSQNSLIFYAFDLPFFAGYDLREVPLEQRKEQLASLVKEHARSQTGPIRLSEHLEGDGAEFLNTVCRRGLEGIVCKRRDAPYASRRSPNWLKVKCSGRQEFVIGGYTRPGGSRTGFGALFLGYFDDRGALRYCGKVGTGFNTATLNVLKRQLDDLATDECPFASPPVEATRGKPTWVEPKLVAEIEFTEWTEDGALRHPSFQGLREDKEALDVVREVKSVRKPRAELRQAAAARSSTRNSMLRKSAQRISAQNEAVEVAGVRLTHPDRILYPDAKLTKRDVAQYYEAVADWILPYVTERPLTIVRCPEGQSGECFFQKNWKNTLPAQVGKVAVRIDSGKQDYVMIDDVAGLVALVQVGALEFHPWGSKKPRLETPDQIVFDLDPGPGVAWSGVRSAARELRVVLEELGLQSFVRTSGGKGLHVVVPLTGRNTWEQVKTFAHDIAFGMARHKSDTYVSTMSKDLRKRKIFIDYLRNQRGATSVASYSTRNRAGAPVATPVAWEELGRLRGPAQFTVANVPARLKRLKSDPWQEFFKTRQSLSNESLRAARGWNE
ncbi:MAG: DNA ligase D [Pirellula sp.]|nr:DNA ligase D [Pirellula sp.]